MLKDFFSIIVSVIRHNLRKFTKCGINYAKKFYIIDTSGLYYKTFYGRNLWIFVTSWSFCPWQAFKLLALPTNIRLDWKGLPGTNILAYYENS